MSRDLHTNWGLERIYLFSKYLKPSLEPQGIPVLSRRSRNL